MAQAFAAKEWGKRTKHKKGMSDSDLEDLSEVRRRGERARDSSTNQSTDVHIQRLERVLHRVNERTQHILRDPEESRAYASRIAESFRTPEFRRRVEQRGRPTEILLARVVCLRLPTTRTICRLNYAYLARYGLDIDNISHQCLSTDDASLCTPPHPNSEGQGNPSPEHVNDRGLSTLKLDWGREDLTNFIQSLFPVLLSTEYELCRSEHGGRLAVINHECWTTTGLRETFLGGRQRLPSAPTLYVRPLEVINHRPLDTPTLLRRVPEATPERTLNETYEETRRLRETQEAALAESLRTDRQRERRQQVAEVQRQQRERYIARRRQGRERDIQNLREARQAEIPPEPVEGVTIRFRFPGGTTSMRRFSPSMSMNVFVCVAGSQPEATREFFIHLPGCSERVAASTMTGSLADSGIRASTTIHIMWADVDNDHSGDSADDTPIQLLSDDEISESGRAPSIDPAPGPEPAPGPDTGPSHDRATGPDPVTAPGRASPEHAAGGENTSSVLLQVRRASVVADLLAHFEAHDDDRQVRVEVTGEQAVDENGVLRDVLTAFWSDVIGRYFEGEDESVPVVCPSVTLSMWRAIGNIFVRGFLQVGYIPIQFSLACLVKAVFGEVALEILIKSWLATLGGFERRLMTRVMAGGFTDEDQGEVIEVFDRFHVGEQPNARNVRQLAERCASVMCVERTLFPLNMMRLERLRGSFDTVQSLTATISSLRPNGRMVASMVTAEVANPQQERVMQFLRQFIRGADDQLLRRFLRFCNGSDVVNFQNININFVHLYGLERRVVAHTCSVTLDVPITYISYNEFCYELRHQLSSDVWEMDYA